MNLAQWLAYIEQCHPSTIELGLDRISRVASRLPIDLSGRRIITVAGTNGKGSTVSMLASILEQGGYRCGCYTSPHLLRYNERVRMDGRQATDDELCDSFAAVEEARGEVRLTYFEFGTLAALQLFSRFDLDAIILEVGLGGRLDAVNIVDPDLAVLTNVALDHTDWLGGTREEIGFEKAGIFRPATPALIGETDIPAAVLAQAKEVGAPVYTIGREFHAEAMAGGCWQWSGKNAAGHALCYRDLPRNDFPLENCAVAIQAVSLLAPEVTREQICGGLSRVALSGRFQQVDRGYPLILDVAHNPHAAARLAEQIKTRYPGRRIHLLLAMLADKDYRAVIDIFRETHPCWYAADIKEERGLEGKILYNYLLERGETNVRLFTSVPEAFAAAEQAVQAGGNGDVHEGGGAAHDILLVTGSFLTVSAVLELI